jgi:hypothetical protein
MHSQPAATTLARGAVRETRDRHSWLHGAIYQVHRPWYWFYIVEHRVEFF